MILRRRERKRDAVPKAAPTLRTIDPTRRSSCISRLLATKPSVQAQAVVHQLPRPGEI